MTIKGEEFTGATEVDFGANKSLHFKVVSSTKIIATSPAGTDLVDVTVTTPSGLSAVNSPADQFSYRRPW